MDELGRQRPTVVTAVWRSMTAYQPNEPIPGVNLVLVSEDQARTDSYGRQIVRETSVVHLANQLAHGLYWRGVDEEAKPTEKPCDYGDAF